MCKCKFLLVFHCNYGSLLYHFRNKVIFFIPAAVNGPDGGGGPRRNIALVFGMVKLAWYGYQMVKRYLGYDYSFRRSTQT